MQTIDNLYSIDYLYPRILILELIEKTKGCAVVWNKIRPAVYKTHWKVEDRHYDVSLTYLKTTFKIDFARNGRSVYNVDSNAVAEIDDLYQIVDLYLEQDDSFLPALQSQLNCRRYHRIKSKGGVVAGGTSAYLRKIIKTTTGGVVVGGSSSVLKFLPGHGGVVVRGSSIVRIIYTINIMASGGVRCGGIAKSMPYLEKGSGNIVVGGVAHVPMDVYVASLSQNEVGIKKVLVNGSSVLLSSQYIYNFAVDAVNKIIFYAVYSNSKTDIYRMNINGSNVVKIQESNLGVSHMAVSGTKLYFANHFVFYPAADNGAVISCNYNGSGRQVLFGRGQKNIIDMGYKNGYLFYTYPSSSGSHIDYFYNGYLGVIHIPVNNGLFNIGTGAITAVKNKVFPNKIDLVFNYYNTPSNRARIARLTCPVNNSLIGHVDVDYDIEVISNNFSSDGGNEIYYSSVIDSFGRTDKINKFNLDDGSNTTILSEGYKFVSTGVSHL